MQALCCCFVLGKAGSGMKEQKGLEVQGSSCMCPPGNSSNKLISPLYLLSRCRQELGGCQDRSWKALWGPAGTEYLGFLLGFPLKGCGHSGSQQATSSFAHHPCPFRLLQKAQDPGSGGAAGKPLGQLQASDATVNAGTRPSELSDLRPSGRAVCTWWCAH